MNPQQGYEAYYPQQGIYDQQYMDEWQYQQMMQIQYMNYNPPPPKGPYPGISHQEFEHFDINQQQQFQKFLREVAHFYMKTIPKYQKEMEAFLEKEKSYTMTEQEHCYMDQYLQYVKEQKDHEKMLQDIQNQEKAAVEAQQKEEEQEKKKEQQQQVQQQQQPEQTQPQPTTQDGQPAVKPKKKLKLQAKQFEIPKPPATPAFPKHPECVDIDSFTQQYYQYLNYFQPSCEEEYLKYPTPESEKKRKANEEEKRKKKEEEIQRAIAKRNAAMEKKQKEPPKPTQLKEKQVDLENIEVDLTVFVDPDETRQPVNLVFIGHVDAGKSTLCGRILVDLGEVSKNDIQKYEQEAIKNNRDSWWLAYVMDQNEEEQAKGKTVECGKALFSTKTKRFILSDAPGHKNYVPNMIMGACQADLAGLIISSKLGEFESGFEKGGQTQEHAILAKSLGVDQLLLVITKMDTISWNEDRYNMISESLTEFAIKSCKFQQVHTIPIDALSGQNINSPVESSVCSWYKGPCLLDLLDQLYIPKRDENGPIRIPILDKFKDQGNTYLYGKLESGKIVDGLDVTVYPKKQPVQITGIYNYKEQRMKYAKAGENIKLKVKGLDEEDLKRGNVICNLESNPCLISNEFQAKLVLLDLPESKRILSQGYQCVMHLHTVVEEIEISVVEAVIDQEHKKMIRQTFLKSYNEGIVKIQVKNPICVEKFEQISSLGRFALRDEGKSIGFGEILKIKPWKNA